MNVALMVKSDPADASIAHSIVVYDRATDELVSELAILPFLDSLALRITEVPANDVLGAVSYPLTARQVEAFGVLLGLDADMQSCEYFLEAAQESSSCPAPETLEAVAALSTVMPAPRSSCRRMGRISEGELVVLILCLLEADGTEWMGQAKLIQRLSQLFPSPDSGTDASARHSAAYVPQRVGDIISRRSQHASFIKQALVDYDPVEHKSRITDRGRSIVRALRSKRGRRAAIWVIFGKGG